MASILIEDVSDEVHRELERLASEHGRSIEAEVRSILHEVTTSARAPNIGTALAELGARFGGIDLDIRRDQTPARAATFD